MHSTHHSCGNNLKQVIQSKVLPIYALLTFTTITPWNSSHVKHFDIKSHSMNFPVEKVLSSALCCLWYFNYDLLISGIFFLTRNPTTLQKARCTIITSGASAKIFADFRQTTSNKWGGEINSQWCCLLGAWHDTRPFFKRLDKESIFCTPCGQFDMFHLGWLFRLGGSSLNSTIFGLQDSY